MDYVTKYYKNLCEELSRKIQILEYAIPGVNPNLSTRFPTTRLLTPKERIEATRNLSFIYPENTKKLNLGLLGTQDWYTKAYKSYWRSKQGRKRSDAMMAPIRTASASIGEISQQLSDFATERNKPQPSLPAGTIGGPMGPPTPKAPAAGTEGGPMGPPSYLKEPTPSWLSGFQNDVTKAIETSRPLPPLNIARSGGYPEDRVDYKEVERAARQAVEERERKYQEKYGPKPQPTLTTLAAMNPDERSTSLSGMRTSELERMQKERYLLAKEATRTAAKNNQPPAKLGSDVVATLNDINATLEDRKGPLGGKRNVQSYVDRLNRNNDFGNWRDTDRALKGKTYKELTAMRDALDQEIRAGFASGNKTIDPTKRSTLIDLNRAIDVAIDSPIRRNF
jgi:hypothetical protein